MARLRSKTAAHCLQSITNPCDYGGLDSKADKPITKDMVERADVIVCMEIGHRTKLRRRFKGISHKMQVWAIPDDYEYMDNTLVTILNGKAEELL